VIDWNGGELRDGDHTGQLMFSNAVDVHERFVIQLDGGATGSITHGAAVTFRSAIGTYLTAMPPDYSDSQLRNYGTWIGPWQRFSFQFVAHYDKLRPAWN
jgi:hypothetical protein